MKTNACLVLSDEWRTPRAPGAAGDGWIGHKKTRLVEAILVVLLLTAQSASPAQSADAFRLAGVSAAGSKRYDTSEIARATGLKVAENITVGALKEAANRLASTGVFAEVSYRYETRGNTMTVVFTVEDAARFLPCTIRDRDRSLARCPETHRIAPPNPIFQLTQAQADYRFSLSSAVYIHNAGSHCRIRRLVMLSGAKHLGSLLWAYETNTGILRSATLRSE